MFLARKTVTFISSIHINLNSAMHNLCYRARTNENLMIQVLIQENLREKNCNDSQVEFVYLEVKKMSDDDEQVLSFKNKQKRFGILAIVINA